MTKPDLKFEALLVSMAEATGDIDVLRLFDEPRFKAFLEFVECDDFDDDQEEEEEEEEDWEDEEEECPLCKKGMLDDSGGCDNPKCIINKLGGQ